MDQRTSAIDEDLKSIVHTRVAIAEKLDLLEQRIKDTAEGATMTFSRMLDHTTESVNKMADKTKAALDPVRKVEEYPWLMLGSALCAGFAIGLLESRTRSQHKGVYPYYPPGAHASRVMPESARQTGTSDQATTGKTKGVYDYYPTGSQSYATRSAQEGTSVWDSMSQEFKDETEQAKNALMQVGRSLMFEVARKMMPEIARSFGIDLSTLSPSADRSSRSKDARTSQQRNGNRDRTSAEPPAAAP